MLTAPTYDMLDIRKSFFSKEVLQQGAKKVFGDFQDSHKDDDLMGTILF